MMIHIVNLALRPFGLVMCKRDKLKAALEKQRVRRQQQIPHCPSCECDHCVD